MSDTEKTIASLKDKGFLDDQTIGHLRSRLKTKLRAEENQQEKELSSIKDELIILRGRLSF